MKLGLKIAAVVVATYFASMVVLSLATPAPRVPRINESEVRAKTARDAIILRHPIATLRRCGLVVPEGAAVIISASHKRLVRVARCLERKNLITSQELRTVERDKDFEFAGASGRGVAVRVSGWAWQVAIVWLVGAALIGSLLYRHWKRRRRKTA